MALIFSFSSSFPTPFPSLFYSFFLHPLLSPPPPPFPPSFISCLIVLIRNFCNKQNQSGKSWHPCLVPDFKGNAFSFSLLSMTLAVVLSYIAFIVLMYIFIHNLSIFFKEETLNFFKCFFCICWNEHNDFYSTV